MIRCIGNLIVRLQTKGYRRVPLFFVTFDYKKFLEWGKKDSCTAYFLHPDLKNDEFLNKKMQECIDYVRDTYDMEQIVKL